MYSLGSLDRPACVLKFLRTCVCISDGEWEVCLVICTYYAWDTLYISAWGRCVCICSCVTFPHLATSSLLHWLLTGFMCSQLICIKALGLYMIPPLPSQHSLYIFLVPCIACNPLNVRVVKSCSCQDCRTRVSFWYCHDIKVVWREKRDCKLFLCWPKDVFRSYFGSKDDNWKIINLNTFRGGVYVKVLFLFSNVRMLKRKIKYIDINIYIIYRKGVIKGRVYVYFNYLPLVCVYVWCHVSC